MDAVSAKRAGETTVLVTATVKTANAAIDAATTTEIAVATNAGFYTATGTLTTTNADAANAEITDAATTATNVDPLAAPNSQISDVKKAVTASVSTAAASYFTPTKPIVLKLASTDTPMFPTSDKITASASPPKITELATISKANSPRTMDYLVYADKKGEPASTAVLDTEPSVSTSTDQPVSDATTTAAFSVCPCAFHGYETTTLTD